MAALQISQGKNISTNQVFTMEGNVPGTAWQGLGRPGGCLLSIEAPDIGNDDRTRHLYSAADQMKGRRIAYSVSMGCNQCVKGVQPLRKNNILLSFGMHK